MDGLGKGIAGARSNDNCNLTRRELVKGGGILIVPLGMYSLLNINPAEAQDMAHGANNFYKSDHVTAQKVAFRTQYQTNIVGNLFIPNTLDRISRHPALVVGHPMGAVKEQAANLYATKMAEQGFVALSFDLPFWGESDGQPRNAVSTEFYAEGFSAAVDYLGTLPFVDQGRIGGIGVCAGGGFIISAAKIDSRLKAIATASLVDMGGVSRNLFTAEQRRDIIAAAARQRWIEFSGGKIEYTGGTVNELGPDTSAMQREYYDFYRTPRGEFTPIGSTPELTTHPTLTSNLKFLNFYPFNDIETISPRPMLFICGDQAFSRMFTEEAYARAAEPKELVWVPGASHVDLYDRVDLIPFDKLTHFFRQHLA